MRKVLVGLTLALALPLAAEPVEIRLWRHETKAEELMAGLAAIDRFNRSQDRWSLVPEMLPADTYPAAISAAALARQLPCVFDVDQPLIPNFAWAGHVRPLDELLGAEQLAELSDGAKGMYKGTLYSVGQFDVVLVLFARRSQLERYGVRIATRELPYSHEELLTALRKIKEQSPELFPFDLNSRDYGEWLAYGFSPWLQSAGGDLIDRSSYLAADGHLNGPAAVSVVSWYQTLFEEGLTERKVVDDQALVQGRAVLHYTGSWEMNRYTRRFGDDLVIMPPPDFGQGPKAGAGSWHWAISNTCEHPAGAAEFLEFLLRPEEIAANSNSRGLIPTTEAGAALTANFAPGAGWRVLYEFARAYAVKRPETPGYPVISAVFEKAMMDVRYGKNVEDALDFAADFVEYDIERNRGYGFGDN